VPVGNRFARAASDPNAALLRTSIALAVLAVLSTVLLGAELWGRDTGHRAALLLVYPFFQVSSVVPPPSTAEAVAGLVVGRAV
jgi:hypothetical protein